MSKHYFIADGDTGDGRVRITARDIRHAREQAERWLDESELAFLPVDAPMWISAAILDCAGEHVDTVERQLEPEEPECSGDYGLHEWTDEVVTGHGGGVIITERCAHCGLTRATDTWAQNPSNGVQGYTATTYRR